MKIGFLGGSFDPIHFGHLLAAQDAFEQAGLDRLFFMPVALPPLKERDLATPDADRITMIRLAIEWDPRFDVRDDELQRGGVSYTIDTALALRDEFPDDQLFWIIGDDQARQLGSWSRIGELARLVEFIVLDRPGHEQTPAPDIPGLRMHRVVSHRVEVSSTELRERAQRGLSLHYFVPLAVTRHITERGLYRE
jgi:nicotinate-nucleotide adenylyltransferase